MATMTPRVESAGDGGISSDMGIWAALAAFYSMITGGSGSPVSASAVGPSTYYVDNSSGNDANTGKAPGVPWQHAPGDRLATGMSASTKLSGGDVVRFRGGVPYRGVVRALWSGSPNKPIQYLGTGYGPGAAIFDGADPVKSVSPCPSAQACGMAPDWQQLVQISYTEPASGFVQLYDSLGPLDESQYPAIVDSTYPDDINTWSSFPKAAATEVQYGRLNSPAAASYLMGQVSGEIAIWVQGNAVVRRPILSVAGTTIIFDGSGLKPYVDRDGRFAIVGASSGGLSKRSFAKIGPGMAVARLDTGSGTLSIGAPRGGFDLNGSSYLTVNGFTFAHQTTGPNQAGSIAVVNLAKGPSKSVMISNNIFRDAVMWNMQGAVVFANTYGYTVTKNSFISIRGGSGVRLSAGNSATIVKDNFFQALGRTAIAFFGVSDGQITGNFIRDAKGLHGNGISLYLANRRVTVSHNCIVDSTRPMTFDGEGATAMAPGDHNFMIADNVFVGTVDSQAALTSWGGWTRQVTIQGNTLLGGKAGLLLDGSDIGIVATGNRLSGLLINGSKGSGWVVAPNTIIPFSAAVGAAGSNWCQ